MFPLVGRDREITTVLDFVHSRRDGPALVVRGEAGIGKSAILTSVRNRLTDTRVLLTRGVEPDFSLGFDGLYQLLRPLFPLAADLPRRHRAELDAVLDHNASGLAGEPYLLALAVLELLSLAAKAGSIVCIVEDAQWLDEPSTRVLTFLVRRLGLEPVTVIAATRDGHNTLFSSLGLPELHLQPLQPDAAQALLDTRAPHLTAAARRKILDLAAGNPLALLELPDTLANAAGPSEAISLSRRLEVAFAARLTTLPERCRLLCTLIAVADETDLPTVLHVTSRLTEPPALSTVDLQPALDANLLELHDGHVLFRHPLVRSATYQATSAAERRRCHVAVAEALAHQPDRRAWHLAAATVEPSETIAAEVEASATRAVAIGGSRIAVAALERAAELTPEPHRRTARRLIAAEVAMSTGDLARAASLAAAIPAGQLDARAQLRFKLLSAHLDPTAAADPGRVLDMVGIARGLTDDGDIDLALAFLELAAAQLWMADSGAEPRAAIRAAAIAVPAADTDPRLLSVFAMVDPQELGGAVISGARRMSLTRLSPEDGLRIGRALNICGAFDLSAAFLAAAATGLRRRGRLTLLPEVLAQYAWTSLQLLDWANSIPAADEASRLASELRQPFWEASGLVASALLAGLKGDDGRATQLSDRAEAIALPLRANAMLCGNQLTRGLTALAAGRYRQAFDELHRMFDPADPTYHHHQSLWAVGDVAEAAIHSGHLEPARKLVATYEPLAAANPSTWFQISLLYARALLADDDTADQHFTSALATDLSHWPLYRGRLLLEHGRWLRRHHRTTDARARLRAARQTFDALGVPTYARQARRELEACGELSAELPAQQWERLSPQELHVAQLAADGMSNREIARRLFLSHRTVASHLYRAYPKLGITSRLQLRDVLRPTTQSIRPSGS